MPDTVTYIIMVVMVLAWIFVLFRFMQASIYFQKRSDKRIRALHAEARRERAAAAAGSTDTE